jgi:hypothetical protein
MSAPELSQQKPSYHNNPTEPKLKLPALACDAHFHVFGPQAKFPLAEKRTYTPADAPKEVLDWLKLLLAEDIPPEALRSKDRKTIIPPLHGALLKNEQDVHLFERLVFMTRAKA